MKAPPPLGGLCPAAFRKDPQWEGELGREGPDYKPYPKCRGVFVSNAVLPVLSLVHQRKLMLWALEAE